MIPAFADAMIPTVTIPTFVEATMRTFAVEIKSCLRCRNDANLHCRDDASSL